MISFLSSSLAADAIVILLTLPFYACVYFRDTYIDEGFAVTRNADVTNLEKSTWYDILVHDFWGQDLWPNDGIHWTHKSYRPLITFSFRLSYYLFPEDPLPSLRLINCVTHTLTCLVVRRCWFFRDNVYAAFLFAVHPVHVENIVYMVGRADSAATLFYLLGADSQNLPRVALCTVLSGLCKETGFTLPILVAFLCLVQKQWVRGGLFLGLFVLVFALRSAYVQGTHADFGYVDTPVRYQDDMVVRFWSYLMFHQVYAQLLLFPWNLSWDYSYDSLPLLFEKHLDLRVMGIFGAYAFLISMFFRALPRRKTLFNEDHAAQLSRKSSSGASVETTDNFSKEDSAKAGRIVEGAAGIPEQTKVEKIDEGDENQSALSSSSASTTRGDLLRCQNDGIVTDLFAAGIVVVPFVPASNLFFLVGTTIGERLLYPCSVGSCLLIDRLIADNMIVQPLRRIFTTEIDVDRWLCCATRRRRIGSSTALSKDTAGLTGAAEPVSSVARTGSQGVCSLTATSHLTDLRRVSLMQVLKILYLAYYMYVAYVRTTHWRNKETLFEQDAKASRWQPRSAKILHQYAVLLQAKGDHDRALEYYQKALNVFDDNAMSDYCMARIWLEKGDCQKGLQIFIKINDGHGIGFGDHNQFLLNNDFGYALACVAAYQEARPILEEALQLLHPNFAYVYNSLALSIFHTAPGELQRVVDLLQTGISLHPDEFTLWFNMGIVLLKGNVIDEAQKAFSEAESKVKNVFEYQMLVDGVEKMKKGQTDALQLLWLKVPVARG
ncbi:unnamed protein product [Amoebophrya sp. A25]|nr:unnamed protein product [Amoebophrya sp. A25]|eukprot:GSA25T00025295001.1